MPSFVECQKLHASSTVTLSDCSVFCEDWARALVKGEKYNPVFLRQVIENYKLKVKIHADVFPRCQNRDF